MVPSRSHVVLIAEYISSGGTRTYVERLLRFYSEVGARVTMVHTWASPDAGMSELARLTGTTLVPYSTINPRPLGEDSWGRKALAPVWSPVAMLQERRNFRNFLRRQRPDYVVVSTGTPGMFLGAAGAVAAATYILHTYPHGRRTKLLGPWLLHSYIPRGLQVVAVSEFQARAIRTHWRLSRAHKEVLVVPSTVGPLLHTPVAAERGQIVLTAAGLVDYKNPRDWIKVAESLATASATTPPNFVWIGEGPLRDEVINVAAAGPAAESISFEGLQNDVDPYYAQCAVYLQLSAIESLGLSVLDALRRGIPCVVTDVGGLPELVTEGETGFLVSPGDIDSAAAKVALLLAQPELRTSMGRAAQELYEERFSPEKWVQGMLAAHVPIGSSALPSAN